MQQCHFCMYIGMYGAALESWSEMRGGAIRYYRGQYSFSQIGIVNELG